jgi:hypothetical protein
VKADLATLLKLHGLPAGVPEYRFAPPRRWRFDCCWPDRMLAVEVEGGVWTGGRHTRPVGYLRDVDKYNEASLRGWTLLRVTPAMVADGRAVELIRRALAAG